LPKILIIVGVIFGYNLEKPQEEAIQCWFQVFSQNIDSLFGLYFFSVQYSC